MPRLRDMKKGELFGGKVGSKEEDAHRVAANRVKEVSEELEQIQKDMDQLRSQYEMYFMGIERLEPLIARNAMRSRIRRVREMKLNNHAIKFKTQTLQARMVSLENYWGRINRQREAGTYFRDKAHVRRMKKEQEAKDKKAAALAEAEAAAATEQRAPASEGQPIDPGQPAASRPPPRPRTSVAGRPSARSADDLTEPKLRQLYQAYSLAKRRCGQRIDLRFDDMSRSLKKQVPKLMKSTGAKAIEFKVVIKKGKAVLKAVPKS